MINFKRESENIELNINAAKKRAIPCFSAASSEFCQSSVNGVLCFLLSTQWCFWLFVLLFQFITFAFEVNREVSFYHLISGVKVQNYSNLIFCRGSYCKNKLPHFVWSQCINLVTDTIEQLFCYYVNFCYILLLLYCCSLMTSPTV